MADTVLKDVTVIVAISVLCVISGFICFTNIDHGLLEVLIILIAGLAGFKLKDSIDAKTIIELEEMLAKLREATEQSKV